MATPKFATVKGTSTLATSPYYTAIVQHESVMSKKQTYAHLASTLKYSNAAIKATYLGLGKIVKEAFAKANDALIDGVLRYKIYAKGGLQTSVGPWVKGVNSLVINPLETDSFRNALKGVTPENITGGLKPVISTVLDTVTGVYDVITGTDSISIGGTNLAPDTTKTDELAYILFDDGTSLPMTIETSSLTLVTAKLTAAPTKTGKAKLVIATRCGLGSEFGVKLATRIVEIAAA